MAENKGCLKKSLIGCGGLLAAAILLVIIVSTLAFRQVSQRQEEEPALAPLAEAVTVYPAGEFPTLEPGQRGRVIMLLGQGEFSILPGPAGNAPSAEARYDPEMHEFIESFELLADSTWVYKVGFRQTKSGFAAFIAALFGENKEASVRVLLPRDVPFELDLKGEAGGVEMELGGLWITDADIRFEKGGIMLSVNEPMPQPAERFLIQTRMGGVQIEGLGNASPRLLGINCGMGGANVDLDGQWRNDCDAHLVVTMGGMAVSVPDEIDFTRTVTETPTLRQDNQETATPQIRFAVSEKMGEIDIVH